MITEPTPDSGFSQLERDALDILLTGDDPVLDELRAQLPHITGVVREFTGVGFWTDVHLDESTPLCSRPNFELTDVAGSSPRIEHGFMVILFVRDGVLSLLEGFTFVEPWPDDLGEYQLMTVSEFNSRLES